MRPKQWLHAQGHIDNPNQRGRLSRDHIALIEGAVREGVKIDGYGVSTDTAATEAVAKVERVSVDPNRIADVPEAVRPDTTWAAHIIVGGEKVPVGMRTVCNTCNNSLTYCHCRHPYVYTGVHKVDNKIDTDAQSLVIFTMKDSPNPRYW